MGAKRRLVQAAIEIVCERFPEVEDALRHLDQAQQEAKALRKYHEITPSDEACVPGQTNRCVG